MKYAYLILTLVFSIVVSQRASADAILTEQFAGYATGQLGASGTGGGGTIPGWNTPRGAITVTNGSGSLDGTGLGLVSSAGDMVYIASGTPDTNTTGVPNGAYNKFVNSGTFPPTVTTNLYCSFLYRFEAGTDVPTDGAMIAGMYLQSGGIQSAGGADAYWQIFARQISGGNIQLGIAKNVFEPTATSPYAPGVTNWATTNITLGQTFFVVVRLQINATNNVSTATNGVDDIDDLWINPPRDTFGADENDVPTPSVSSPIGDGAVPTSGTGPGRFFIVDDGPGANLDELRISTTWADVTPPLGQCLTAGITTDLTNMTQSAEINANFTVGAVDSTSPSYQWQISQNGGSTWTDIPGAIFSSYTTPNLQLATDNGNKYRTIVSVACDNSSATSSVSTVTLTAPVVTPPGLIMDDNFADGFRGNTPVTTNNSVWFTSVTADLDAYPGDTGINDAMVATPIAGTSSLYLGYFVDESTVNQPVDLAIGNTVKVTFPFIPNSFNSFTNNGSLRFGLFDYADGGTLITADSSTQPGSVTGSAGNGVNVRGYMLDLDFGTNFSSDTPLTLYVRNGLGDIDLMGTTGDYLSMGSGPVGGAYSSTPAFQAGTTYTLTFSVTRTDVNACSVTAAIAGGSMNLSFTATDTNTFGYHRFDAFAMRPNKLENAADTFTIPEFKVEVTAQTTPQSITITNVSRSGNNVILSWNPTPAGAYSYSVQQKANLTDTSWTILQSGITTTSYTNTVATGSTGFYRVSSP
jgi:hypothetical protein